MVTCSPISRPTERSVLHAEDENRDSDICMITVQGSRCDAL